MQYEEALREWGARKLEAYSRKGVEVTRSSVDVAMNFNEGYACCGGSDPDCYCSFAESPSADVIITGYSSKGTRLTYSICASDFDFASILGEIVEAAGTIE